MGNQEEEKLLREAELKNGNKTPLFEAPDGKVLATGDSFRGPYTGITSDIDLDNPGQNRKAKPEAWE